MTPALRVIRQAVMIAFKCFINCEGQSHKTVSSDHNFEEKGEPKQIQTEVPLLTSLKPVLNWANVSSRT